MMADAVQGQRSAWSAYAQRRRSRDAPHRRSAFHHASPRSDIYRDDAQAMYCKTHTHRNRARRAWALARIALALLGCAKVLPGARAAEQAEAEHAPSSNAQLLNDPEIEFTEHVYAAASPRPGAPPYRIQIAAGAKVVHIEMLRCMQKQETSRFADCGLPRHRAQLKREFSKFGFPAKYTAKVFRSLGAEACASETCCANPALQLLSLLGSVPNLRIAQLEICNITDMSDQLPEPAKTELFSALAERAPLVVETCEVSNVSSYVFCGLAHVLKIGPGESARLQVRGVRAIDLEAYPAVHLWDLATLSFSDVGLLCLGNAVEFVQREKDPAYVRALEWMVQLVHMRLTPGAYVRVSALLEVLGYATKLTVARTTLCAAHQAVVTRLELHSLVLVLGTQGSVSRLVRMVHEVLCQVARIHTQGRAVSVVVGRFYYLSVPEVLEDFAAQLAALLGDEAQKPLEGEPHLVDIREACSAAPVLYVQIRGAGFPEDVSWAVELSRKTVLSVGQLEAALYTLRRHRSKQAARCAIPLVESMVSTKPNREVRNRLLSMDTHAQATLLPCGCFKEPGWNRVWHSSEKGSGAALFDKTYARHLTLHRDYYPTFRLVPDCGYGNVGAEFSRVLFWDLAGRAAPRVSEARADGYRVEVRGATLAVTVLPVPPELMFPSLLPSAEQIAQDFPAELQKTRTVDPGGVINTILFENRADTPPWVYRYLSLHFLHALALQRVAVASLVVQAPNGPFSLPPFTPYQRVALAQLAEKRERNMWVFAKDFFTSIYSLDDLAQVGRLVQVGRAADRGSFFVTLHCGVEVHVQLDATCITELSIPAVEKALANLGWHVGVLGVHAPHTPILYGLMQPADLSDMATCLHRTPVFPHRVDSLTLAGPLLFCTPRELTEYPRGRDRLACTSSVRHARFVYAPHSSLCYICDPQITLLPQGPTVCIAEYLKKIVECLPSAMHVVFFVAKLEHTHGRIARRHVLYPKKFSDAWKRVAFASFRVFLHAYDPELEICLPVIPPSAGSSECQVVQIYLRTKVGPSGIVKKVRVQSSAKKGVCPEPTQRFALGSTVICGNGTDDGLPIEKCLERGVRTQDRRGSGGMGAEKKKTILDRVAAKIDRMDLRNTFATTCSSYNALEKEIDNLGSPDSIIWTASFCSHPQAQEILYSSHVNPSFP